MGLITMNEKELMRLRVIEDLTAGSITPGHAAGILQISTRRLRVLRERFLKAGPAGLASGHRGKPSNRATPIQIKRLVMEILRAEYPDFGPTFATEKLREKHGLSFNPCTIRPWMKEGGLWADRRSRRQAVHQPRYRRECYGELVQIDGSQHHWFEDRGPPCTLLVYIDDATSRLMQLKFVQSESAFSYFAATTEYLERHGKPVAFYSDKHSIFRVTRKGAVTGDGMTQFGRALHELNIDIICANTPQAKGRVERANRTLQDRLVKELRLKGISTPEAGNEFLPEFIDDYNRRFGKDAVNSKDLHRRVRPEESLREVFVWREERTVSSSLTLQYDKTIFILEPSDFAKGRTRKRVTVCDYPDGRLVITHDGRPLPFNKFDTVRQVKQGAIVDNKRLGAALSVIKESQSREGFHRSQRGPRRLDQSDSVFSRPSEPISALRKRRRAKTAAIRKATQNVEFLPRERDTVAANPAAARSSRLPVDFDPSKPVPSADPYLEVHLELMEKRNRELDRERKLLNRRRYASRRKYLKVLTELEEREQQNKLAA